MERGWVARPRAYNWNSNAWEHESMTGEKDSAPQQGAHWADWLSAHMWWTTLLAGGILCVTALILS